MELLKTGAKAGTKRLTYGQSKPLIYGIAIAVFVVSNYVFDTFITRFVSMSNTAVYVGGFILGLALFRSIMKIRIPE